MKRKCKHTNRFVKTCNSLIVAVFISPLCSQVMGQPTDPELTLSHIWPGKLWGPLEGTTKCCWRERMCETSSKPDVAAITSFEDGSWTCMKIWWWLRHKCWFGNSQSQLVSVSFKKWLAARHRTLWCDSYYLISREGKTAEERQKQSQKRSGDMTPLCWFYNNSCLWSMCPWHSLTVAKKK